MFTEIYNDLRRQLQMGDQITRIIVINTVVFITLVVLQITLAIIYGIGAPSELMFNRILEWIWVSPEWQKVLFRPWTVFTYMFTHTGIWHFAMNMLVLFWFGRIFQLFLTDKKVWAVYILGGLAGFLAFFLSANFIPTLGAYIGSGMIGASAGVTAIVVAAATIRPDYEMHLILIGPVKIKYIALVFIVLDLLSISKGANTGGHLAHLGGALLGFVFIKQLQAGNDWSVWFNNFVQGVRNFFDTSSSGKKRAKPKKKKSPLVAIRNPRLKKAKPEHKSDTPDAVQERVDAILDKIRKHGMDSLTDEEKEFLYNASKK